MDLNEVLTKLNGQVVCREILAPDETGAMQSVGRVVDEAAVLNDIGDALYAAATATGRRRRKAPSDAVQTGDPEPAPEPAVEPAPAEPVDVQNFNLNITEAVQTDDAQA